MNNASPEYWYHKRKSEEELKYYKAMLCKLTVEHEGQILHAMRYSLCIGCCVGIGIGFLLALGVVQL